MTQQRDDYNNLVEAVVERMYWERVNPHTEHVTLSVLVVPWSDLSDEHRSGYKVWHCKQFWRDAASAALAVVFDRLNVLPPTVSGASETASRMRAAHNWSDRTGDEIWSLMIAASPLTPGDGK
jgi:hypothetical protein